MSSVLFSDSFLFLFSVTFHLSSLLFCQHVRNSLITTNNFTSTSIYKHAIYWTSYPIVVVVVVVVKNILERPRRKTIVDTLYQPVSLWLLNTPHTCAPLWRGWGGVCCISKRCKKGSFLLSKIDNPCISQILEVWSKLV